MSELTRVSISLESSLLEAFDQLISSRGYANRSEAIRDLIRDRLVHENAAKLQGEVVGVLMLVYDHHSRELATRLIDKQHHHHQIVVSSLHVHLGSSHCLEVSILRGQAPAVRQLADDLIATRGVLHGNVTYTSDEQAFRGWSEGHEHGHSHGSH